MIKQAYIDAFPQFFIYLFEIGFDEFGGVRFGFGLYLVMMRVQWDMGCNGFVFWGAYE